MSADFERDQRTRAFREVGIVRCADFLAARDIPHPSDQLTVVYGFLGSDMASGGIGNRPHQWMEKGLEAAARTWHSGEFKFTWPNVLDASRGPIEWAPGQEFGNLLSVRFGGKAIGLAARRLRQHGVEVGWATLVDIRDDFTALVLPKAVHTFDPGRGAGREEHWLSTLFYRYALRSIRSDHARREQLDLFLPVCMGVPTPEEVLIDAERDASSAAALGAMGRLSADQQLALRLYFGVGTRERSLGEIGRTIGLNRLKARNLVVHGLARLALASSAGDRLGEVERSFARKLFDDGMPPAKAAREMGVSASEMAGRIGAAFESALRARTVPHHGIQAHVQGDYMNHFVRVSSDPAIGVERNRYLNGLLAELDGEPRIDEFGDGPLRVELGGELFKLDSVREAVTDATVETMLSRGLPVDWLLSGPASSQTGPLAKELEAAQVTRWETASELVEACEEKVGLMADSWPERDLAVRKVCTTLIAVSQALDRELPADALLAGGARMLVGREGGGTGTISAWWDISPPTARLDVPELFRELAMAAGGLSPETADVLGALLTERLASAEFVPDGFVYAGESAGMSAFERPWLDMDFE